MEALDNKIKEIYSNQIVNKDLTIKLKQKLNLPTYVIDNLLLNHQGTDHVEELYQLLQDQIVNPKDNLKVQDKIRHQGSLTVIDKITAKSITGKDSYLAHLMKLGIKKAKISNQIVKGHPKLFGVGLWAKVKISYLGSKATKKSEFKIEDLSPCERTTFSLEEFKEKSSQLNKNERLFLLLRSIGIEPTQLSNRQQLLLLTRLIPFVEKNYNFIELGPRGTGKSYLYRQLSNQSILVSGGKTTVANLFYNMGTKEVGLVGNWDVIAFDEVAYIDFKDKTAIQILKDYMESGAFSRGKEEIDAAASMIFLGNINTDLSILLRDSNLFEPLPDKMKDMALIDRFHYYLPGWEINKIKEESLTKAYGLESGYLALMFNKLRELDFTNVVEEHFILDEEMDIRDKRAVKKTVSGYLKLLHPSGEFTQEDLQVYLELALEGRKRVKEQLTKLGSFEYEEISFEYTSCSSDEKYYPVLPEYNISQGFKRRLAKPGTVYVGQIINGQKFALLRIEVDIKPGSGKLLFVNKQIKQGLKQDVRKTFLFIKRGNGRFDLRKKLANYDFSINITIISEGIDADISNPVFLAIYSALNNKSVSHGLLVTEESSLYRKPDNSYIIEAVKVSVPGDKKRVRTLLPLKKNNLFVQVPSQVIEQAPVFIEV
ncbi:TIGR02688 family protein [Halobacteroides halobius DSM 5150]|uniref:TIGR02688 family protein n=1 Tax=Halobacteroides halobius (strain ATCC 35273 / DSM 5150 / MD-1) TaxID=748449 RepID=L0KDJ1_HALHC|nr:BREX system Lon protease-like protein BrxL [Halobacteroides halobius]AGB42439.1 TIGR02688 family protein [Halobacteroides halobius DSM 5150]